MRLGSQRLRPRPSSCVLRPGPRY